MTIYSLRRLETEHGLTTVSTADRKNPFQMHEGPKYILLSAAVGKNDS